MNWAKLLAPAMLSAGAIVFVNTAAAEDAGMPMKHEMGMMGMKGMQGNGCPMMGKSAMHMNSTASMDKHISELADKLDITDAQKTLWTAYASALSATMSGMPEMHKTMMGAMHTKSPLERIDAHIGTMKNRLKSLEELRAPLSALYDTLSEDQKEKASKYLTGMGCMMM